MPDRSNLLALVGHMKVEQLARLAGLGVEELVAAIVGARPPRRRGAVDSTTPRPEPTSRATTELAATGRSTADSTSTDALTVPAAGDEPPLAAMFGQVTHRELHRVVDRWLLGRVLAEEGGNVSHAAQRLGISRRTLREHRDRANDPSVGQVDQWARGAAAAPAPDVPAPPPLAALLERGGTYRDLRKAIDRWLIGTTLAHEQGNVTRTAGRLGMSRKDLRARWARVQP